MTTTKGNDTSNHKIVKDHHHISTEKDFSSVGTDDLSKIGLLRVDLACGQNKREGFIGVDSADVPDVNIKHNLNVYPYPFEDGEVFEIHCSHFIEHVADFYKFMRECYRILMDQGVITILAPYYTSIRAVQDPTHIRFINEMMFQYLKRDWRKANKIDHYGAGDIDFNIDSIRYYYSPEWITRSDEAREFARRHYYNVVDDIEVVLRANKK